MAEKLVEIKEKFESAEKFKEALSSITVFVLRSKEFSRSNAIIEALGLPCDPIVCLTYLREYLHKETTRERVDFCLDK